MINLYISCLIFDFYFCRWLCRVYMIHFWMVENHYPDRVMRQFDRYQSVPPPPPLPYDIIKKLRLSHNSGRDANINVDWEEHFRYYINEPPIWIEEMQPYDHSEYDTYIAWFFKNGMPTIFFTHGTEAALSQPLTQDIEPEDLDYVPHGQQNARMVCRLIIIYIYDIFSFFVIYFFFKHI